LNGFPPWSSITDPNRDNGEPLIEIGFYVTLYFEDGYLPERRLAAFELFQKYWRLVDGKFHWTTNVKTHNWEAVTSEHSPEFWLSEQPKEPWIWDICFHNGQSYDSTGLLRIEALGGPPPSLSYMSITLPPTWFADHPQTYAQDLMLHWASRLRAIHGSAGLGIMVPLDVTRQKELGQSVRSLAQRLPGLEVDYPLSHSIYLQKGIKSVNWLTCLDERFLNQLGGIEQLRAKLNPNLKLLTYPGGAVLQAGAFPEVGDREPGRIPENYRAAAALLRPIQASYPAPFPGFGGQDATDVWLHRFD
jgi:hypothetical protein